MKTPDITKIRKQLHKGDLTKIGDETGVSPKHVSEFFAYGWHKQHTNSILTAAADLIQDSYPDQDVIDVFNDLGLTSYGSYYPAVKKQYRRYREPAASYSFWMLFIIIPVILYFIIPGFKTWVNNTWMKVTGKKPVNASS